MVDRLHEGAEALGAAGMLAQVRPMAQWWADAESAPKPSTACAREASGSAALPIAAYSTIMAAGPTPP